MFIFNRSRKRRNFFVGLHHHSEVSESSNIRIEVLERFTYTVSFEVKRAGILFLLGHNC